MKLRKLVSLVLAFALVLSFSVSSYAASGDVIWQLTKEEIEDYIESGNGSDYLQNSGSGSEFASVSGNSLKFAGGRADDYSVVDIKVKDLCKPGVAYTLVVRMTAPAATHLVLGQVDNPWGELASADGKDVTISYKFTDPASRIRLQGDKSGGEFTVVSAILYEGDAPAAPAGGGAANPATGDSSIIILAIAGFALAMGGAAVFYRKAKAQ